MKHWRAPSTLAHRCGLREHGAATHLLAGRMGVCACPAAKKVAKRVALLIFNRRDASNRRSVPLLANIPIDDALLRAG